MSGPVLVTGVTGQDGTLLARRLLAEGREVHGLVQSLEGSAVWATDELAAVVRHEGDLGDADGVTDLVQQVAPAEVYHLGGQSSVAASWDDPVGTARVTGLAAAAVLEGADRLRRAGHDVRVLQASSAEIFGRAERSPQDERTPVHPVSPYGAAKALAHHLAEVYRSRGLAVATTILFNHESTLRPPTFVTRKITQAAARIGVEGGGVITLGNLDASRDWGWAPDYVDAMVRACRHEQADDFVVATGEVHTVGEFAAAALARVGVEDWRAHVEIDQRFVRPTDASVQVGDATKAREVLGWRPTVAFTEIVGRMVDHDVALLRGSSD